VRAAAVLTVACALGGQLSAHRLDEYLQAARLAVEPGHVDVELDLTPGVSVAQSIISDIDRNGDGSLSLEETRDYERRVLAAVTMEIDGQAVPLQPGVATFPDVGAFRRGDGTIRLRSSAALPRLSAGAHQLLFRNTHRRDVSVYLANALVPDTDGIAITAQRRDGDQSELMIEFLSRPATPSLWHSLVARLSRTSS
jgi:hypothetical protein